MNQKKEEKHEEFYTGCTMVAIIFIALIIVYGFIEFATSGIYNTLK